MKTPAQFNSLLEVVKYFKTERICLDYLQEWRWKNGMECPHCGHEKAYKFSDNKRFKCAHCKKQFTATVGTIFENTKVSLIKWYLAIFLVGAHKKGISSHQLAKDIEVTQKTAWFMLQRIRKAMEQKTIVPLSGIIMADETFVGGKNKNRHLDKKAKLAHGRMYWDKTPVLGLMEHGGQIKTFVVPDTQKETIAPIVKHVVEKGSVLVTDEWSAYKGLEHLYQHEPIDHSKLRYLSENGFSTNPLEGFWSHLKRAIIGVWHTVSKKHLQKYVDEITFKYNLRAEKYHTIMSSLLMNCGGRLTYKTLIANAPKTAQDYYRRKGPKN